MKTSWIRALVLDVAIAAAIVAGQLMQIGFLLNMGLFAIFCSTISSFIIGLFWDSAVKELDADNPKWRIYRTRVWKSYDFATDAAMALLLAGFGYFVVAGCFVLGKLLLKARLYDWLKKVESQEHATQESNQ